MHLATLFFLLVQPLSKLCKHVFVLCLAYQNLALWATSYQRVKTKLNHLTSSVQSWMNYETLFVFVQSLNLLSSLLLTTNWLKFQLIKLWLKIFTNSIFIFKHYFIMKINIWVTFVNNNPFEVIAVYRLSLIIT